MMNRLSFSVTKKSTCTDVVVQSFLNQVELWLFVVLNFLMGVVRLSALTILPQDLQILSAVTIVVHLVICIPSQKNQSGAIKQCILSATHATAQEQKKEQEALVCWKKRAEAAL